MYEYDKYDKYDKNLLWHEYDKYDKCMNMINVMKTDSKQI